MELIGNTLNGRYFPEILRRANNENLEFIRAAVAYTTKPSPLIELAKSRRVTLQLYTLFDGDGFPPRPVLKRFIEETGPGIQLFVTRDYFHTKIYWFGGVGVYIGSANLTDNGWHANLECGVWFDQHDILEQNLEAQLHPMFDTIASRCTAAAPDHMLLIDKLASSRADLSRQRKEFEGMATKMLITLPGQHSPIDPTKEGSMKATFITEWESTLTILKKIMDFSCTRSRPTWVHQDTHAAFVQDQATEHWYHENIRTVGQDQIEILHQINRNRSELALEQLFDQWATLAPQDKTVFWTNEAPRLLQACLTPQALAQMNVGIIETLLRHSHSMRETVRHLSRHTLMVAGSTEFEMEDRFRPFAQILASTRNAQGHGLGDVLLYVIWGDAKTPRCAERVWDALYDPAWKFPYIAEHTLNELIGYARPDEFPPRNNRVRRTLRALGF